MEKKKDKKEEVGRRNRVAKIASILGLISCVLLLFTSLIKGTSVNWALLLSVGVGCGTALVVIKEKNKEGK